ncbi:hypothetical protein T484DRAFT_1755672 [Baffinella frigidus]|nr:hypothetical protein T484DRAFT_1755672 [Cryptophyta sp. CCMP2293]
MSGTGIKIPVPKEFDSITHRLLQLNLSQDDRIKLVVKMALYSGNTDNDPQQPAMDVLKLGIALSHKYAAKNLRSCSIRALAYYKHRVTTAAKQAAEENAPLDKCLALAMALHHRLGDKSHVRHLDQELLRIVADLGELRTCDYVQ